MFSIINDLNPAMKKLYSRKPKEFMNLMWAVGNDEPIAVAALIKVAAAALEFSNVPSPVSARPADSVALAVERFILNKRSVRHMMADYIIAMDVDRFMELTSIISLKNNRRKLEGHARDAMLFYKTFIMYDGGIVFEEAVDILPRAFLDAMECLRATT